MEIMEKADLIMTRSDNLLSKYIHKFIQTKLQF
jgi:hypothetical protein